MAEYNPVIKLDDVVKAKPEMIFYSVNTCWWTHRAEDLYRHPACGLPCDPRSGMLMQTDDIDGFIQKAKENPGHYGKHGLEAFMAAHHQNITTEVNGRQLPTCFQSWEEYNQAIDRWIDRGCP